MLLFWVLGVLFCVSSPLGHVFYTHIEVVFSIDPHRCPFWVCEIFLHLFGCSCVFARLGVTVRTCNSIGEDHSY